MIQFRNNHFKHLKLLVTILWICTFIACNNSKSNLTTKKQPNIILFMVDDMGWQDTSVPFWKEKTDFNSIYKTPNMERLANEGMKFTQAYATPVCTPTRVSLISGMNAARHRVTNWTFNRDIDPVGPVKGLKHPIWNVNGAQTTDSISQSVHITALPQLLKDNGYRTIHVGKAHFGSINTPSANPTTLGFEINIGGSSAGQPGSYYGTENFKQSLEKDTRWDVQNLEEYHGKEIYLSEALTQKSIVEVDEAITLNKPFFLYMAHYAVHTPIQGDPRFEQEYIDQGMHPTEAKYASMVEGMDKSLGDIMNHLEEKAFQKIQLFYLCRITEV